MSRKIDTNRRWLSVFLKFYFILFFSDSFLFECFSRCDIVVVLVFSCRFALLLYGRNEISSLIIWSIWWPFFLDMVWSDFMIFDIQSYFIDIFNWKDRAQKMIIIIMAQQNWAVIIILSTYKLVCGVYVKHFIDFFFLSIICLAAIRLTLIAHITNRHLKEETKKIIEE